MSAQDSIQGDQSGSFEGLGLDSLELAEHVDQGQQIEVSAGHEPEDVAPVSSSPRPSTSRAAPVSSSTRASDARDAAPLTPLGRGR